MRFATLFRLKPEATIRDWKLPFAALLVPVAFLVSSPAPAAVRAWDPLTVRVYDSAELPPSSRRIALEVARRTMSALGVDVAWRECSRVGDSGEPVCATVLSRGELTLRLVRKPLPHGYGGKQPLGTALIDTATGAGVLATVYYDRVSWLARTAGADTFELLGHAVAHELTHLVLASNRHSARGLMRAVWSVEEVSRRRRLDWTFTSAEIDAVRARALGHPRLNATD